MYPSCSYKVSIFDRVVSAIQLIAFLLFPTIFLVCCTSGGMAKSQPAVPEVSQYRLADRYYRQKNYAKAKTALKEVLKENPDHKDAHYRLGVILGKEGAIKDAIGQFEKTISIDPDYGKAYYNLGVLHITAGDIESTGKAIRYFDRFLELNPDSELRSRIETFSKQYNDVESRQKRSQGFR
jgi:tetratricopeptide (TPR) repeat protein